MEFPGLDLMAHLDHSLILKRLIVWSCLGLEHFMLDVDHALMIVWHLLGVHVFGIGWMVVGVF